LSLVGKQDSDPNYVPGKPYLGFVSFVDFVVGSISDQILGEVGGGAVEKVLTSSILRRNVEQDHDTIDTRKTDAVTWLAKSFLLEEEVYNPPSAKIPLNANLSCHALFKLQMMGSGRAKITKSITTLKIWFTMKKVSASIHVAFTLWSQKPLQKMGFSKRI